MEYALKPVLAVLGATSITNSVYIVDKQIIRLEEGFAIAEEAISRLEAQLEQLQQVLLLIRIIKRIIGASYNALFLISFWNFFILHRYCREI